MRKRREWRMALAGRDQCKSSRELHREEVALRAVNFGALALRACRW
jgi:hypothetical protein